DQLVPLEQVADLGHEARHLRGELGPSLRGAQEVDELLADEVPEGLPDAALHSELAGRGALVDPDQVLVSHGRRLRNGRVARREYQEKGKKGKRDFTPWWQPPDLVGRIPQDEARRQPWGARGRRHAPRR